MATSREEKNAKQREYYRRNREAQLAAQKERDDRKDPEAKRAYRRAYWEANRERLLEQQRERGRRNYQANPERYAERGKKARLKKYGLTLEEYTRLLEQSQGLCAICEQPMERPVVDHDHSTGAFRGILCNSCNTALGGFRDNPQILRRAIAYLERSRTSSSSGATSTPNSD